MTKLKVCDIREDASRVEHGMLSVCVCLCLRAQSAGGSYPYGPCTDLIWPGGEEVFQLQGGVARLDDFVECAGKRQIQTILVFFTTTDP